MDRIVIVTPVYTDWDSLRQLLDELNAALVPAGHTAQVVVVDDASAESIDPKTLQQDYPTLRGIRIVRLVCNLGHQRAIAVGMAFVARNCEFDIMIVMDSDGEDRPADAIRLVEHAVEHPGVLVVARRVQRSEGVFFRLAYFSYIALFRLLTGRQIRFGNFCLLPSSLVHDLIYYPDVWSNLAASLLRSPFPIIQVPTRRGKRYRGFSKMNSTALVMHGLTAIAVFADIVLIRILVAIAALLSATTAGLIAVIGIRLFTGLAIPGWASQLGLQLVTLLILCILTVLAGILNILSRRTASPVIPARVFQEYIRSVQGQEVS